MPTLYYLPYSPWSEKARWALVHHKSAVEETLYTPLLGEPALRLRLKRPRGPITVPVLVGDGVALTDSFDIAAWADGSGSGKALIPASSLVEVRRWNEWSERFMRAGRARATARMLENPDALARMVPKPLAKTRLGPALGRFGCKHLSKKYGFSLSPEGQRAALAEQRALLDELRDSLQGNTLLSDFSYADIAVSVATNFLDTRLRVARPVREVWRDPVLADECEELLAWRDAIYEQHR